MRRVSNGEAVEAFLAGLRSPDPALAALARSLALVLDDGPENPAATAREYRLTLAELRSADDAGGDPIGDLLAEMGDASEP
jgi:hypothetical protein